MEHPTKPCSRRSRRSALAGLLAAVVATAIFVVAASPARGARRPNPLEARYGTLLDAIKRAKRVEAHRVVRDPRGSVGALVGYRATKTVKAGRKWSRTFRRMITRVRSYEWRKHKRCRFQPAVVVRFVGKRSADVVLCFACNELRIGWVDQPAKQPISDFEPIARRLLHHVLALFPRDPELRQALRSPRQRK